jgi:hypothetical protein
LKEEAVMSYGELGMPLNGKNAEMVHTGSALNGGLWSRIQHIFSEMYAGYLRNFDEAGPEVWRLMQ